MWHNQSPAFQAAVNSISKRAATFYYRSVRPHAYPYGVVHGIGRKKYRNFSFLLPFDGRAAQK